jgi:hypothetical protein
MVGAVVTRGLGSFAGPAWVVTAGLGAFTVAIVGPFVVDSYDFPLFITDTSDFPDLVRDSHNFPP